MLVKICGVSNAIDAFAAIHSGANAIGFVMGGNVMPVEVEPSAQYVREIIKKFPPGVESVLVTHLLDVHDIVALSAYIGSTAIQVSEDISVAELKELRALVPEKTIIKTIVVNGAGSLERLKQYEPYADFLLLDTRFGGYTGGTGVTNDWVECRALIAAATKPVYVAGGLTPANVAAAIAQTKPHGVDVSTGVSTFGETYRRKDRKSEEKIRDFIRIAKT